jgi:hypothetical protein
MSIHSAASQVAFQQNPRATARDVDVVRTGYYEFKHGLLCGEFLPGMWHSQFFSWRAWVLRSDDPTLVFAIALYREKFGRRRARRLAELIAAIRSDETQIARNSIWLEEEATRVVRPQQMDEETIRRLDAAEERILKVKKRDPVRLALTLLFVPPGS